MSFLPFGRRSLSEQSVQQAKFSSYYRDLEKSDKTFTFTCHVFVLKGTRLHFLTIENTTGMNVLELATARTISPRARRDYSVLHTSNTQMLITASGLVP